MMKVSKSTLAMAFLVGALILGFVGSREGFMQKDAGMPLDGPAMGPYDTAMGGWMSSEHMPVGGLPQNSSHEGNKLMFLVGNKISPECCPAALLLILVVYVSLNLIKILWPVVVEINSLEYIA